MCLIFSHNFRDQVYIPPGEIHLDRLEQEDVFTFNVEFDSDGNPDLDKDATNPCHNISAYTNLYLKIFQVTFLYISYIFDFS